VAAPLLVGSVHRPTATAVLALALLGLGATFAGERARGRGLGGTPQAAVFLLMVVLPALQVVPLPASLRNLVDPAGGRLLENAAGGAPAVWPLSLDPTATRVEIGTAAAALAVFLVAFNAAGGRARYVLVARAVALAGTVAIVSGIVHRLFGIGSLYGLFRQDGGLLMNAFINPNHAAEFYELAAFAALALALDAEAEERIAWLVGAAINAGAAVATLSRGSLLALAAGGVVFLALRARAAAADPEPPRPGSVLGRTIRWLLLGLAVMIGVTVALGATPIVDEVAHTDLSGATEKPRVWKDSLALVKAHPAGVGRHAFDRVYPAYKTVRDDERFDFVENGPLQLLIDFGWLGWLLVAAALALLARRIWREGRKDEIEAALLGALAAVAAHNLVDFGLEIPGIRLPAAALAGAVLGRMRPRSEGGGVAPRLSSSLTAAAALAGLALGLGARWQTGAAELDTAWKAAAPGAARRAIAAEGGGRFPTDYFFPLLQSFDEPLGVDRASGRSPRLAALNRALRLCPGCWQIHREAARALYQAGRRPQALASWRDTVRLSSAALPAALEEVRALGYRPDDLATLAVGDGADALVVARFLVGRRGEAQAAVLLEEARARGAPPVDVDLVRVDIALGLGQPAEARRLLEAAVRAAPRDPRPFSALARLERQSGQLEAALAHTRTATTLLPSSAEYARQRVELVLESARWSELDEALDRLRGALRQSGAGVGEAHLFAGRAQEIRGNPARAIMEYRSASLVEPASELAWAALGRLTEAQGDLATAQEAYEKLAALRPADQEVRGALQRIVKTRSGLRLKELLQ
jgi:tetratricopeptide (TPR) repeat protein